MAYSKLNRAVAVWTNRKRWAVCPLIESPFDLLSAQWEPVLRTVGEEVVREVAEGAIRLLREYNLDVPPMSEIDFNHEHRRVSAAIDGELGKVTKKNRVYRGVFFLVPDGELTFKIGRRERGGYYSGQADVRRCDGEDVLGWATAVLKELTSEDQG